MYDSKIAEKTNSFRDLKDQKTKVESLMYELEKSKSDAQAMQKYKNAIPTVRIENACVGE